MSSPNHGLWPLPPTRAQGRQRAPGPRTRNHKVLSFFDLFSTVPGPDHVWRMSLVAKHRASTAPSVPQFHVVQVPSPSVRIHAVPVFSHPGQPDSSSLGLNVFVSVTFKALIRFWWIWNRAPSPWPRLYKPASCPLWTMHLLSLHHSQSIHSFLLLRSNLKSYIPFIASGSGICPL